MFVIFLIKFEPCVINPAIIKTLVLYVNKDYIETYLIEWKADRDYYSQICNDCKFHKEKIQQSIETGADAEWWNHMCTDFCR